MTLSPAPLKSETMRCAVYRVLSLPYSQSHYHYYIAPDSHQERDSDIVASGAPKAMEAVLRLMGDKR